MIVACFNCGATFDRPTWRPGEASSLLDAHRAACPFVPAADGWRGLRLLDRVWRRKCPTRRHVPRAR